MRDEEINIRMIMPFSDGVPVAPLNYDSWFVISKGFNNIQIDLVENERLTYREYIDFFYIDLDGKEFLRYDNTCKTLYSYEKSGTKIKTIYDFNNYCIKRGFKIKLIKITN